MSYLKKEEVLKSGQERHEVEGDNEGDAGELQQSLVGEPAGAGGDADSLHQH